LALASDAEEAGEECAGATEDKVCVIATGADFRVVTSLISQRLIKSTIYNGEKFYLRDYNQNI
jgi:hypothetical protein